MQVRTVRIDARCPVKSIADQLPPEIARQIHPDRRKNEAAYWAARDQLLDQYRGQWIGFADGKVIASGTSPVTVFHAAEATGLHPFFICVGREEEPCRIRRATFPYDTSYPGESLPVINVEFSALLRIKIQSLEHRLAEMKEAQVGKLFLDVLASWFFQAHLDLVDERSHPLFPGAEEELAAGPGRERAAQSRSEFLRHLGGSVFGVCHPEPEDGVVGLARPLLKVHESVPGPIQQIIAPGINDPFVQIRQSRADDDGHLHVRV
jgi:hypothetical protein